MTVTGDPPAKHVQSGEAPPEHRDLPGVIATWSASGITVSDIAVERDWTTKKRLAWYVLAGLPAIVLIVGILISSGTSLPVFCCLFALLGVAVVVGLPLLVVAWGSTARAARRAIREAPAEQIQAALAEHSPALPAEYLHGVLKHVARLLVDSGRLGRVLRIGPPKTLGPVEPLAVPFEPHVLDSIDEESQSEPEERGGDQQATRERGYVSALRDSFRPIRKWLSRYGAWVNLLVWVIVGIAKSLRSGQIDFVIYGLGMGCLVGAIVRFRQRGLRELQPLIVPGAFIVRDAGWRSRGWRVTMFEPHETVFLMCRFPGGQWELLLSSQTRMHYFKVTPAQAEAALRAWLSPLSPPALKQLSDLC